MTAFQQHNRVFGEGCQGLNYYSGLRRILDRKVVQDYRWGARRYINRGALRHKKRLLKSKDVAMLTLLFSVLAFAYVYDHPEAATEFFQAGKRVIYSLKPKTAKRTLHL